MHHEKRREHFLQALSYACSQWASLPAEDVAELPADLLLALLADESLEARPHVETACHLSRVAPSTGARTGSKQISNTGCRRQ